MRQMLVPRLESDQIAEQEPLSQIQRKSLLAWTGENQLDHICGPLEAGKLSLIQGNHALVQEMVWMYTAQTAIDDRTALYVDGGNTFNPYVLVKLAKQRRSPPLEVLERVVVARGFTCHQLLEIVLTQLPMMADQSEDVGLIVLPDFASMLADEQVSTFEARRLQHHIVSTATRIGEEIGVPLLLTVEGNLRRGLGKELWPRVDHRITVKERWKGGVGVTVGDVEQLYWPNGPAQRTLEEFMIQPVSA